MAGSTNSPSGWKSILATVAPTVATMLGGPLAGMAVKALSNKLLGREDGSEEEVAAAVAGMTPSDIIRLKEIDAELTKVLADNNIKLEALDAQDRDSARRRATESKDWTPSILTFMYTALVSYIIIGLMQGVLTLPDNQIVSMLIGGIVGAWTQSNTFQFGTTRGSQNKDKVISSMSQGRV